MEFNAESMVARTKALRAEFGSTKKLAEAAGCSPRVVYNYCSLATVKKTGFSKRGWEKHFGPWDNGTDDDTAPAPKKPVENDIVEETVTETPVAEEPAVPEKKRARLVIEVPSLEELEETLSSFGFRLEFIPR